MARRLEGKVAIVVGAGQQEGGTVGNGRATALVFAREGARLVLTDVDKAALDATVKAVRESYEHTEIEAVQADVGAEADCKNLVAKCIDRFGRVDILHNNVGIAAGDAGTVDLETVTLERITRVNTWGILWTCKAALPHMREQGSGAIVNVSSIGGRLTLPEGGGGGMAYKMSKAAVNTLTENMAMENAKYGVRCNAILPGLMDTPLSIERRAAEIVATEGIDIEPARKRVRLTRDKQVPLHFKGEARMGSGWDTANAALFLCSDEAKFITGVLLPVDGGQCVRTG